MYSDPEFRSDVRHRDKHLCIERCGHCCNMCSFEKHHNGDHKCKVCIYPERVLPPYDPSDYEPIPDMNHQWTQQEIDTDLDKYQARYPWITRDECDIVRMYDIVRKVSTKYSSNNGGRKFDPRCRLEIKYRQPM